MTQDQRGEIIEEIFKTTGMKVTVDDPIITAALINSSFIRAAVDTASGKLQVAAAELIASGAVDRQLVANLSKIVADRQAKHSPLDSAQLQRLIAEITKEISGQVKKDSVLKVQLAWKSKIIFSLLVVLVFVGAGGTAIGALFGPLIFPKLAPSLTQDQKTQIRIGKAIVRVLPQLDKDTRDKLSRALDQQ